jgi:hypothetical protein
MLGSQVVSQVHTMRGCEVLSTAPSLLFINMGPLPEVKNFEVLEKEAR